MTDTQKFNIEVGNTLAYSLYTNKARYTRWITNINKSKQKRSWINYEGIKYKLVKDDYDNLWFKNRDGRIVIVYEEACCKFCGAKDSIMVGNKCDACRELYGID